MPKRHKAWLGHPPTHKSFRPYAITIGQAALAWNGLHEAYRGLFCAVLNADSSTTPIINSVWYSIPSDRSQRQMVEAAATTSHEAGELSSTAFKKIKWLLGQSNSLAEVRNDVIHSPLISAISPDVVLPATSWGHPRARRLAGKHLLTEFRWCREAARTLTDFCMRLELALTDHQPPPDIPKMPNRGQKKLR
jgi:hypothetical protein